MRRIFHCTMAALSATGACAFFYLTITQSFVNIVFAVTGAFMARWSYQEYLQIKIRLQTQRKRELDERIRQMIIAINMQWEEIRRQEIKKILEETRMFRLEHIELLNRLEREYRGYVADAFAEEEDFPIALSAATERMILKYGDGIYAAFRETQPGAMLCLSLSMYVADLNAAKEFISNIKI